MVLIAAQKALPERSAVDALALVILSLQRWRRKHLRLTGVVCEGAEEKELRKVFKNWRFAELETWQRTAWKSNVPNLKYKEKSGSIFSANPPCSRNAGRGLERRAPGHSDRRRTLKRSLKNEVWQQQRRFFQSLLSDTL